MQSVSLRSSRWPPSVFFILLRLFYGRTFHVKRPAFFILKVLFKQAGSCWIASWWIGTVCTCDWVPVSTSECGRAQVRPCVAHGASLYGCKSRIVWQGISCLVFNRPIRLSLRYWMSKQSVLNVICTTQCKETAVIFNDWRINNWDDWAELSQYQAWTNRQAR